MAKNETNQNQTPPQAGNETVGAAVPNDAAQNPSADGNAATASAKTVRLLVRHKSTTQNYFRAGLRFTKNFAEYEVPKGTADALKADKWLEVKGR